MRFILVIIFLLDGKEPVVSQQTFATEPNCERAKKALSEELVKKEIEPNSYILACLDRGSVI